MKPQYFVIPGILLILVAGGIFVYDEIEDYVAEKNARLLLMQVTYTTGIMSEMIQTQTDVIPEAMPPETPAAEASFIRRVVGAVGDTVAPVSTQGAYQTPNYDTVGIISIPRYKLSLPVIDQTTEKLLKISVCLYSHSGNIADKPERMVINGHNNKSHFGKITGMALGDEVNFTRLDGEVLIYEVIEIVEISMYETLALQEGKWDLTLFTCNKKDRSMRILIRCAGVGE